MASVEQPGNPGRGGVGAEREGVRLDPRPTTEAIAQLFCAHGASAENARVVAAHLIESERLGLPSHGLVRVRQYLSEIEAGLLRPDATPAVDEENEDGGGTILRVNGHSGFGQVAGRFASLVAERKASANGTAFVSVRNVQHTGRLGAYTEVLAANGFMAVAFAAGAPRFHRVVPFGGRDGRLSTNPIAWAAPMSAGLLSADFSTSAMPEGRIRLLHAAGEPAPSGTICDAAGVATTDTRLFYGDEQAGVERGSLLPLGGPLFGHKGYALGLLSECMATVMSGETSSASNSRANNLALIAIRGDAELPKRITATVDYMKSSRPARGHADVLVPGEPERRRHAGSARIEVPGFLWYSLAADLAAAGLDAAGLAANA